jgi:tetratricopeptide (TPR) repeat protein
MKVTFHLRRRATAEPVAAVLLPPQTDELVRWCAASGEMPTVFAVAEGFLVMVSSEGRGLSPPAGPPGQARRLAGLRLRRLAANIYLPGDADLMPALLADEAADLGRRRGLVFLPGGRVLEFNPARPVPLGAMLTAPVRRDPWQALPESPPLAERLTAIVAAPPDISPDELLAVGGEDIGIDDPRPEDASLPRRALGSAAFGAGKALAWLGQLIGSKGLAGAGLKWMKAGLSMSPRKAESWLGQQDASLRALLRAFREGKIDQALRRAIPVGGDERGATLGTGTRLPFHNLIYSLSNLLGDIGGGAGGVWFTESNLFHELSAEYRKQAELAAQRGDFRRAAFIFGKLLRDFRAAAAVLSRGGLHRDAAIIYLKRLGDALAAAQEYEAAGDLDRALELYRQRHEHFRAGDLLRRAGEEQEAVAEYRIAVDRSVTDGGTYYRAGELMRTRAGLPDLAVPYYLAGWDQRPTGSPVPCAVRLAEHYTEDGDRDRLLALARQADDFLADPGSREEAAAFYNTLARLADRLPDLRDDLRDRALVGIARKLREGAPAAELASTLLGEAQVWPAGLVSDAQFALRPRGPQAGAASPCTLVTVRARIAVVRAVCQAANTGELFLGFESGEVKCYRPHTGEIGTVADEGRPILSLATTAAGDAVVVLSQRSPDRFVLKSLVKAPTFTVSSWQILYDMEEPQLCPGLLGEAARFHVGVRSVGQMRFFSGPTLVPFNTLQLEHKGCAVGHATLLWSRDCGGFGPTVFTLYQSSFVYRDEDCGVWESNGGGWTPGVLPNSSLAQPVVGGLTTDEGWELAGIDGEGNLHYSDVRREGGKLSVVTPPSRLWPNPRFSAVAILQPGRLAAVTAKAVHWLRRGLDGLKPAGTASVALPLAVACFRHQRGRAALVVCADGTVAHVPAPERG